VKGIGYANLSLASAAKKGTYDCPLMTDVVLLYTHTHNIYVKVKSKQQMSIRSSNASTGVLSTTSVSIVSVTNLGTTKSADRKVELSNV